MVHSIISDKRIENNIPREFRQYLLQIEALEFLKMKKVIKGDTGEQVKEEIKKKFK